MSEYYRVRTTTVVRRHHGRATFRAHASCRPFPGVPTRQRAIGNCMRSSVASGRRVAADMFVARATIVIRMSDAFLFHRSLALLEKIGLMLNHDRVAFAPRLPKLLVTGCPRSGTKYISRVLQALGADVTHHTMGHDGLASWCMAVTAADAPWGPARDERQRFDLVFHQVRNPARVIPSMVTLHADSWAFVCRHVPCDPSEPLLLRCAKCWYYWNRQAERIAQWRYRIEALEEVFPTFCERVGVRADRAALERVGPRVNSRAFTGFPAICKRACDRLGVEPPARLRTHHVDPSVYRRVTACSWDALRRLDPNVADQVWNLAHEYGYADDELTFGERR